MTEPHCTVCRDEGMVRYAGLPGENLDELFDCPCQSQGGDKRTHAENLNLLMAMFYQFGFENVYGWKTEPSVDPDEMDPAMLSWYEQVFPDCVIDDDEEGDDDDVSYGVQLALW